MYDMIYWPLCVGETKHVTPQELVPEMARYTILVDGISKAFAATGVRVSHMPLARAMLAAGPAALDQVVT